MLPSIVHRQTIFRLRTCVKRPAAAFACWIAAVSPGMALSPGAPVLEAPLDGFSAEAYTASVNRLFERFEAERGEPLRPGEKGKVGLKVYTASGPGLTTPLPLVRAVAKELLERGFARENIFLIDQNERRLRRAGFLPRLAEGGADFDGHPVYVLESGKYFNDLWYHESPLPPARGAVDITYREGQFHYQLSEAGRRSFLPVPLMLEVDFWINLPAYTDHPVLGINGALVNATLWNASNTARFFGSEASGPAAVAEMAAIPELAEKWVFSIVSLERYQFLGGPDFNSLYTESEPMLWLSADPVALDSRMYQKINDSRRDRGFPEIDAWMTLLDYAMKLNLWRP